MAKMIWSEAQEKMVVKGFSRSANGFRAHYTWNDDDEVYYNDEDEEDYYMTIPASAGRCFVTLD